MLPPWNQVFHSALSLFRDSAHPLTLRYGTQPFFQEETLFYRLCCYWHGPSCISTFSFISLWNLAQSLTLRCGTLLFPSPVRDLFLYVMPLLALPLWDLFILHHPSFGIQHSPFPSGTESNLSSSSKNSVFSGLYWNEFYVIYFCNKRPSLTKIYYSVCSLFL